MPADDAPAPDNAADPEIIEAEPAAGAAGGLPPGMPPFDEPGFPTLPMFGGEIGELFNSLSAAQSMFMMNTEVQDGVGFNGMAILSPRGSQAILGTQVATSRGNLKAELVSQGLLQATVEGFPILPFAMSSLQLAFVGPMLAGGTLQAQIFTPFGLLFTNVNTMGQTSAELLTGGGSEDGSTKLMFGAHLWGMFGRAHGMKAAVEWQNAEMEGEKIKRSTCITAMCSAPFVAADGAPLERRDPTVSLSAFQRLSASNTLAASIERAPNAGVNMTVGGTRQVTEHTRLRGKWGTTGVLAMALEISSEKSALTLTSEVNTSGGLDPKFGATLNLSL